MRPESSYFITPAEFLDAKHRSVKGQRFMVESICGFYNQTIRVTIDCTAGQVTNELSQQSTFARTRQTKTENVILLIGGCQNILRFVADYEMPTLCRLKKVLQIKVTGSNYRPLTLQMFDLQAPKLQFRAFRTPDDIVYIHGDISQRA